MLSLPHSGGVVFFFWLGTRRRKKLLFQRWLPSLINLHFVCVITSRSPCVTSQWHLVGEASMSSSLRQWNCRIFLLQDLGKAPSFPSHTFPWNSLSAYGNYTSKAAGWFMLIVLLFFCTLYKERKENTVIKKNLFHNLISSSQKISEGKFRTCMTGLGSAAPGRSCQIKYQLFWAVSFMPIAFLASEVDIFLTFRNINSETLEVVLVLGKQSVSLLKQRLT